MTPKPGMYFGNKMRSLIPLFSATPCVLNKNRQWDYVIMSYHLTILHAISETIIMVANQYKRNNFPLTQRDPSIKLTDIFAKVWKKIPLVTYDPQWQITNQAPIHTFYSQVVNMLNNIYTNAFIGAQEYFQLPHVPSYASSRERHSFFTTCARVYDIINGYHQSKGRFHFQWLMYQEDVQTQQAFQTQDPQLRQLVSLVQIKTADIMATHLTTYLVAIARTQIGDIIYPTEIE